MGQYALKFMGDISPLHQAVVLATGDCALLAVRMLLLLVHWNDGDLGVPTSPSRILDRQTI